MMPKVQIVRRSLPGVMVASCASPRWMSRTLATRQSCSSPWIGPLLAERLIGDVAPLPGRQGGLDRRWIGAGPEREIEPARLPSPGGQEVRRFGPEAGHVDARDDGEADMAVVGQVARDPGDAIIRRNPPRHHGQRLPDHVLAAQQPAGFALREHRGAGLRERRLRVAGNQRKPENVEETIVDQQDVVGRQRLAVAHHDRRARQRVDRAFDLREIRLQTLPGDVGGHLEMALLAGLLALIVALELVAVLRIGQPRIVARLVADVEQQHQAGGEADAEAEDVDEGIGLVLDQRPDADGHVVAPHICLFLPWAGGRSYS